MSFSSVRVVGVRAKQGPALSGRKEPGKCDILETK